MLKLILIKIYLIIQKMILDYMEILFPQIKIYQKFLKEFLQHVKKERNVHLGKLKAEEIVHDKNKKIINYKNAWLEIYDKPVIYFPKFFHPDPTVKRQSGFLIPSLKTLVILVHHY